MNEPGTIVSVNDNKAKAYFIYYNTTIEGKQVCISAMQNITHSEKQAGLSELHKVVNGYYDIKENNTRIKNAFRACENCERFSCGEDCKHYELRKELGI